MFSVGQKYKKRSIQPKIIVTLKEFLTLEDSYKTVPHTRLPGLTSRLSLHGFSAGI